MESERAEKLKAEASSDQVAEAKHEAAAETASPGPFRVAGAGRLPAWVRAHVARLWQLSKPKFIAWITVESYLVWLPLAGVMSLFWTDELPADLQDGATRGEIFLLVVFAPLVETLIGQTLPMRIARALRGGRGVQLLAGAVPFGALHFENSWQSGWSALIGGFYLAFTYLRWREQSFSAAFWMTVAVHAVHNAIETVFALATGEVAYVPIG